MQARFAVEKSHSKVKPWLVVDNASDPAEDAVLYFFSSKQKAEDFRAMLISEASPVNNSTIVA